MSSPYLVPSFLLVLGAAAQLVPAAAQAGQTGVSATATPAAAPTATAATLPASLASLLAMALHDRPEMRAAMLGSGAARERIRQAAARFYPTIDLQMSAQRTSLYDTFSGITATGTIQGQPVSVDVQRTSPKYTVNPTLEVAYELYSGGRDAALLRNAQAAHRGEMLGVEVQTREVMREVTLGYLRLGQAWHRWDTARRWADVARKQEHATARRFAAGRASDLEVNTDTLARAQRDLDVLSRSQDVAIAHAAFLRVLGQAPAAGATVRPEDLAPFLKEFVRELDALEASHSTSDGAAAAGGQEGPESERARATAEAARALVAAERAAHLPQVKLLAQYTGAGRSDESIGTAFGDTRKSAYAVGLLVSFNLFSGFSIQAREAEARLNAERLSADAAAIQGRLSSAWQSLQAMRARARAEQDYARQRRQVEALRLKVMQAKMDAGRASTEDVDLAHMSLAAADADVFDKRIDLIASDIRLKYASTRDMSLEGGREP